MNVPPILTAQSISKIFDTFDGGLNTVANINLAVQADEFLCIVGPSGCGKTTLLQLLGGLLPASKGEVRLDGKLITEPNPAISIVFQKPNLMPWRTVLDNVLLPLQIIGMPGDTARQQALDSLAMVGLSEFVDSYPKALSGGMEQRVAVARALVQQPRLLLLDEPFSALDALTRERLNFKLMQIWHSQHLTTIMVTHNIREAVLLADRVLVLSSRPATIAAEFHIELPRPRPADIEYSQEFGNLAYRIRQAIHE